MDLACIPGYLETRQISFFWRTNMSTELTAEVRNQRIKEFLQILPLTIELAGLPQCDPNRLFSADQMDLRCTNLKNAYKLARQLLKELSEGA
jgi:hypothetical protein